MIWIHPNEDKNSYQSIIKLQNSRYPGFWILDSNIKSCLSFGFEQAAEIKTLIDDEIDRHNDIANLPSMTTMTWLFDYFHVLDLHSQSICLQLVLMIKIWEELESYMYEYHADTYLIYFLSFEIDLHIS